MLADARRPGAGPSADAVLRLADEKAEVERDNRAVRHGSTAGGGERSIGTELAGALPQSRVTAGLAGGEGGRGADRAPAHDRRAFRLNWPAWVQRGRRCVRSKQVPSGTGRHYRRHAGHSGPQQSGGTARRGWLDAVLRTLPNPLIPSSWSPPSRRCDRAVAAHENAQRAHDALKQLESLAALRQQRKYIGPAPAGAWACRRIESAMGDWTAGAVHESS